MPRLKLFLNHLVVAPIDPPEAGCSPEEHGCCKKTHRGVVLCAGPGKNPSYSTAFKPGDVVWYDQDVGHTAKLGKTDVVVVDDGDIFALESDLENEGHIKSTVREVLLDANVTSDGKFEDVDGYWEASAAKADEAEAERHPRPALEPDDSPSPSSSGVLPGPDEPGGEHEAEGGEHKARKSHHKKK